MNLESSRPYSIEYTDGSFWSFTTISALNAYIDKVAKVNIKELKGATIYNRNTRKQIII